MVQLYTLQKFAVYGAAFTSLSCGFMFLKMQSQLRGGEYFTKSLEALRADQKLVDALGAPVRSKYLELTNEENFITADKAQLCIPIVGSKHKGYLHTRCTKDLESNTWNIVNLEVEVDNRMVPVIIPKQDREILPDS